MDNLSTYMKSEMRRYERKPYSKSIEYSMDVLDRNEQKKLNLRGNGIDISDVGIGIETDYPLVPGHTLWFENGIEMAGIVRWCIRLDNTYRAGIWLDTKVRYDKSLSRVIKEEGLYKAEEEKKYSKLLNKSIEKFNNQLEGIEKRCDGTENPEEIMNEITRSMNDMVSICEKYEKLVNFDKSMIKNAQIKFMEETNYMFSKSYFLNRTRKWPRGYQGDYKTLEDIYRNIPLSKGIGYYMDRSFLDAPLARGVRNRIKRIEEILRSEILSREKKSVLNIACGSCRELMGLTTEIGESKARIICIDNDNDAIAFAHNRLSYTDILPQIEIYKYNALRMFDYELNMKEFWMQDIIYSVGYFDYLPDEFLVKMLNALYKILNPGGKLIAAFKDSSRYRAQEYHWLVDWDGFLQRTKDDFDKLLYLAGIPNNRLSISREATGVIIFYIATK